MRVEGVKRTSSTTKVKKKNKSSSMNFEELFELSSEDQTRITLGELLEDIKEKGKSLSEDRNIELLLEYKNMIKEFVEEAVEFGLKITQSRGFGRLGRTKIMRIVQKVDDKILELTDYMLKEETKKINMLNRIGEIQGLLTDLIV